MADLATTYMGLKLRNPIIVSSSDLTKTTEGIIRCYDAGAGAVVLKSLFEEQFLIRENVEGEDGIIYPEALDYLRRGGLLEYAPEKICQMIEEAKKEINIPIIASINCQSPRLWPSYARQFEEAGADGLELNIYFLPISLDSPGAEYEEYHLKILEEVKKAVTIPVAVKLMSQLTSIPYLGYKLARAGCDALVLFNWFVEPDIDVKNLKTRNIIGKGNFYQSLRWVALLAGRVDCDVASSGGVRKAEDVIKQILAGASAVQVCTILYEQKFEVIKSILSEVEAWMEKHKNATIDDFKGELSFKMQELTFKGVGEADAYFRAQYLKAYSRAK
ncbi:MAG: dihydroorotate dehydrogenase-like protein [Candidatus Aminicenantes bacterium]|nr:MAG: dihydroorotate dehydrogenase-like protein [Candidatus Aminicenantes bacterium]